MRIALLAALVPLALTAQNPLVTEDSVRFQGDISSIEVFVDAEGDLPALSGEARKTDGGIVFHPRYPFRPGQAYKAILEGPDGTKTVRFAIEQPPEVDVSEIIVRPTSTTVGRVRSPRAGRGCRGPTAS